MKPVHVRRILVIWLLLLHIFTLLWTSLSSVISKPNILFPDQNILQACARRLLLICRESKKIPVTTSISPKKKWILYSHSVLLPMRSVNSLPVFFTQINNCLSFFPDFFSGSQSKSVMNCIHCFFNIFFRNQYRNTNLGCGDHIDIDSGIVQRLEHSGCNSRIAHHSCSYNR